MIFGGEALDTGRLTGWYERHPDDAPRLVNMYGITETRVHVTYLPLDRAAAAGAAAADGAGAGAGRGTIGEPIPGLRTRLLDRHLTPVPPGMPGEIYVSGAQLARGYLGRPGLTATRFVADPYGDLGDRMYRTGDLARVAADGSLEYLGRADDQVKIRGFRIEPGEIEAVLAADPTVRHAVVIARADDAGRQRLVAYIVPSGSGVDGPALRARVAAALPDFMVPAAVVVLEALPLTGNGKLDRAALPAPDLGVSMSARTGRTDLERVLCAVFAVVLGVDRVGIDDDFLALGGDSIIAIQLVNRARREGVRVTPREVFVQRTPAALAALVAARADPQPVPADAAVATTSAIPGTAGVGVLAPLPIVARLAEWGGQIRRFNQAFLARTPAGVDEASLRAALAAVLAHHDGLRARLLRPAPQVWLLQLDPADPADAELLVRIDVAGLDPAALRAVIAAASGSAAGHLDPDAGAMLRAVWLDAGPTEPGRLVIVAHHLVVDGVSWRILLADLADAHVAVRAGRRPVLDPVGTSLRAFSRVFGERAADPARLGELSHWLETLGPGGRPFAEPPRPLADPTAAPLGPAAVGTVADTGRLRVELPAMTTTALLTGVPAATGAEITDVLLAGLRHAIPPRPATGSADSDLLVDLERHGREEIVPGVDLARTVGWFTSIAPVRLAPPRARPRATLPDVTAALRATPEGGIGFGMLRHANPLTGPVLARAGQPQVLFNYLGRFGADRRADWGPADEFDALAAEPDPGLGVGYPLTVDVVSVESADGPRLRATFTYLTATMSADEAARIAEAFLDALRDLVADTLPPAAPPAPRPPAELLTLSAAETDLIARAFPAPVEEVWPLSPLQEGLHFHSVLDRSSDAYTAQFSLDFGHRLDADQLRRATVTLMARNPTLRAGFLSDGLYRPVQLIAVELAAPVEEIDLTALAEPQRTARAERIAADERGASLRPRPPPAVPPAPYPPGRRPRPARHQPAGAAVGRLVGCARRRGAARAVRRRRRGRRPGGGRLVPGLPALAARVGHRRGGAGLALGAGRSRRPDAGGAGRAGTAAGRAGADHRRAARGHGERAAGGLPGPRCHPEHDLQRRAGAGAGGHDRFGRRRVRHDRRRPPDRARRDGRGHRPVPEHRLRPGPPRPAGDGRGAAAPRRRRPPRPARPRVPRARRDPAGTRCCSTRSTSCRTSSTRWRTTRPAPAMGSSAAAASTTPTIR